MQHFQFSMAKKYFSIFFRWLNIRPSLANQQEQVWLIIHLFSCFKYESIFNIAASLTLLCIYLTVWSNQIVYKVQLKIKCFVKYLKIRYVFDGLDVSYSH